jgi:hypothetical protein
MQAVVPSNVPIGMDSTLNEQLAEAWKDMGERMHQLAKMSNGNDYDENLSPDDVMANLNAVPTAREKKSEKWGRIRQTFSNTLEVISTVGGMVADAASYVSPMVSLKRSARLTQDRCSPQPTNATTLSTLSSTRTRATKAYLKR